MFEDANLFIGLDDSDPAERLRTVDRLRKSVRKGGGELPVHNLTQLFQLLSDRLKDSHDDVALQSAELLCDLLNRDLLTTDIYFPIVLPAMFQNLAADSRRDSSVYVLTTYVEAMASVDCIMEGLVQHGLMHDKAKVREHTLLTLPTIMEGYLVPSASAGREDYMKLLTEIIARLRDMDPAVTRAAGFTLRYAQEEDRNFWKHVEQVGADELKLVAQFFRDHPEQESPSRWKDEPGPTALAGDDGDLRDGDGRSGADPDLDIDESSATIAGGEELPAAGRHDLHVGAVESASSSDGGDGAHSVDDGASAADSAELRNDGEQQGEQSARVSTPDDLASDSLRGRSEAEGGSGAGARDGTTGAYSAVADATNIMRSKDAAGAASASGTATSAPREGTRDSGANAQQKQDRNISTYAEIHGAGPDKPRAGGVIRLVFGLIPNETLEALKDTSAWKARAAAIEELLATVVELSDPDIQLMRPHIGDLLKFLTSLLGDSNFKISITTLHILEALIKRLGKLVRNHAGVILRSVVDQLGDHKAVVRQAALQVFTHLLQIVGAGPILADLMVMLDNKNWHIREAILKIVMHALLTRPLDEIDLPQLVVGLIHVLHDKKPMVAFAAIESLAILHNVAGKEVDVLALVEGLDRADGAEETLNALQRRFQMPSTTLPSVNADGVVEYFCNDAYGPPPTPYNGGRTPTRAGVVSRGTISTSGSDSGMPVRGSHSRHGVRSASNRRHPSAGRASSRRIPFDTRVKSGGRSRASTADTAPGKVPPGKKAAASPRGRRRPGRERRAQQEPSHPHKKSTSDEGRSWRQDPNRVSLLDEKNGKPMQLHISDSDALDFETYQTSLFEDPFDFHASTLPPSPINHRKKVKQLEENPQDVGREGRSDHRRQRRRADNRRSSSPRGRRRPSAVRSPFPFAPSPEPRGGRDRRNKGRRRGERDRSQTEDRGDRDAPIGKSKSGRSSSGMKEAKISLWLPGKEPRKRGSDLNSARSDRSTARGDRSARAERGDGIKRGRLGSRDKQDPTGNFGDLGVVGSGMSVGKRQGQPSNSSASSSSSSSRRRDGHNGTQSRYVPHEHSTKDRRPVSLSSRPAPIDTGSAQQRYGSDSMEQGSPDDMSAESLKDEYWPPRVRRSHSDSIAEESVSVSADDIRDKLKTLKSRGSSRAPHMSRRAASANRSSGPMNAADARMRAAAAAVEQPSTPGPGDTEKSRVDDGQAKWGHTRPLHSSLRLQQKHNDSHQASGNQRQRQRMLGDERPIRPMRETYRDSDGSRALDTRHGSVSAPAGGSDVATGKSSSGTKPSSVQTVRKKRSGNLGPSRKRGDTKGGGERRPMSSATDYGDIADHPDAYPSEQGGGHGTPTGLKAQAEYLTREQCLPVANPTTEMRRILHNLASGEWDECFEALNGVRRLALHHSNVLNMQLHTVVLGVLDASSNLRSSVAKNALLAIHDLVIGMGTCLDPELDGIIPKLLKRASESSSGFLGEEANRALAAMCAHCSPPKVLASLIAASSSRAPAVRSRAACHIEHCVKSMGTDANNLRDLGRVINVGVKFMSEPVQEARHAGRRILYHLYSLGAVEKRQLQRLLQEREYRQVMEQAKRGNAPNPGNSLEFLVTNSRRRSGGTPAHRNRSRSRTRTSTQASSSTAESRNTTREITKVLVGKGDADGSAPGQYGKRLPERRRKGSSLSKGGRAGSGRGGGREGATRQQLPPQFDVLPRLYSQLASSDWRQRQDAVRRTVSLVVTNAGELTDTADCLSIFDNLTPRLADNNSKVNLCAVRAMHNLIPAVRNHLSAVLPSFVDALASNLASTNKQIHAAASEAFNILMANVDAATAFQPVLNIAGGSNPRVKAALFDRITDMLPTVAVKRPNYLARYALPAALRAIDGANGDVRLATHRLLSQLHRCMGDDMIRAVRTAHVSSVVKDNVLMMISRN